MADPLPPPLPPLSALRKASGISASPEDVQRSDLRVALGELQPPRREPTIRQATALEGASDKDREILSKLANTLPLRVSDALSGMSGGLALPSLRGMIDAGDRPASPVSVGMLPPPDLSLPMDPASRLARAKAQGYTPLDRPLYHETWQRHESPLTAYGFDLTKRGGTGTAETHMPHGVFLKPTPASTGLHDMRGYPVPGGAPSVLGGEVQMPLVHRAQNIKQFADRAELEQFLRQDPTYQRHHNARRRMQEDLLEAVRDRVIQDNHQELLALQLERNPQRRDAGYQALDDQAMALYHANDHYLAPHNDALRQASTDVFKRLGHDAIRVVRDAGSEGRFVDTTLILDPSKVRSTRARFEESQMGSKSLLASLLPAGVGAWLAGGKKDDGGSVGTPPPVRAPR